jgi:cytochrome c biogenesis protein CcmG, thiol:disulfide interchange protein DsbE
MLVVDDTSGPGGEEPAPEPAPRRRRRPVLIAAVAVGVVAIFLVVVFAVSKVGGSDTADTPLLDQAAPPITGQQLDGGAFDLSTRRGSWVVLNFFASWCDPCKQEAAELARFASAQQSAGTAGAELVGIVYNDSADAIRSFLQTYGGGNFPVVLDQQGSNAITYGVVKVPETWIIDPSGIVRARVIVPVTADSLGNLLQRVQGAGSP